MAAPARVALADLLSAPITPTARDAVAVIVQLAHSPQTGRPIRQPLDTGHVWLHADGAVTLSPGLFPPVWEIAVLLGHLLGLVETASGMPLGLVAIVEQAAGRKASFKIPSLSALATALAPYQPADPAAAVRAVVAKLDDVPIVPAEQSPEIPAEPAAEDPQEDWSEVILESPPPLPPPMPTPPVRPAADDAPALAPVAEAWRPSVRQTTIAIVATVLAAVAGSAVGRWQHDGTVRVEAAPATPAPAVHEVASPPPPSPTPTPEPEPEPGPAPVVQPAKLVAPRPARLVDRRTVHADGVYSPSFAAHGSAVFFHAEEGGESALKRAEPDNNGELRVATIVDDGARNYHVQQSPDGTFIAFDSDREGERGVYVAKADGTGVRRVSGPGYAAVPTWSPDGRRLAFLRAEPDRASVWNLWLLDRDTGKQTRVTQFRSGQVWGGAWFADGKRIAYSHEDRLHIRDLASDTTREFASPLPGRLLRTPAVSPDGRWIVFQVYRDGAWLLDVERGAMQRVLQDPSAEEFAWSPDGRRVAYHSQRSGGWNLWTMAAP